MDDESEQVIMFPSSKHGVAINGSWEMRWQIYVFKNFNSIQTFSILAIKITIPGYSLPTDLISNKFPATSHLQI